MTPEQWDEVSELFSRLIEAGPDDRRRILGAANLDTEVRAEVEQLLAYHDEPSRGLSIPDIGTSFSEAFAAQAEPLPRETRLGQFTLKRLIGRGASGLVYEAMQDAPERAVAVKVLPFALAHSSGFRRFQDEVAALARLQHPGIAQVIESGTTRTGALQTAFVAMEVVPNAKPVVQACVELPLHDRVRIFTQVCDALHHAHMRGVIHRDIKPANILIDGEALESWTQTRATRADRSSRTADAVVAPKLIDFGVARLVDHSIREREQTLRGTIVGTPQYMAPEQATGEVDSIDVRTDVYALGVVLYRLVSGTMPYEVPSNLASAAHVIATAAPRPLSRIDPALGGDLETIVMTALAKRPEQRYQSAAALSDDLSRWLEYRPILAKPPSIPRRIALWAVRNPATSWIAAGLALSLAAGGTVLSIQARETMEQREVAASVSGFMMSMLQSPAVREKGRDTRVVDVLGDAERSLATLSESPRVRQEAERVLARSYAVLGDYEAAARIQEQRYAALARMYPPDDPRVVDAQAELSEIQFDLGDLQRAEELARGVLAARTRREGANSLSVAKANNDLAVILMDLGRSEDAEAHLRASIEIRRAHGAFDVDFSHSLVNLALLRRRALDPSEAVRLLEEAAAIQERSGAPAHIDLADTRRMLALSLMDQGELVAAQEIVEKVLASLRAAVGEQHVSTAGAYVAQARIRQAAGDFEHAVRAFERATEIYGAALGKDHPYTRSVEQELAQMKGAQ